jgi:protoheme IX farnesyltransferase
MICILRLDGVKIGARWVLYGWCVKRFQSNYRKDLDALMDRDQNRPVPTKETSCAYYCKSLTVIGIVLLYTNQSKTAMFGAINFLYTSIYTPLKQ